LEGVSVRRSLDTSTILAVQNPASRLRAAHAIATALDGGSQWLQVATKPALAYAARRQVTIDRKGAILLDSSENPLGPSAAAREAIATITPDGLCYRDDRGDELIQWFAQQEGLKTDCIRLFAGSSEPRTTPCLPTLRR
jgi:hypothetical protein